MSESMEGLTRSCRCAEVSNADIGKKVTLMGWVQKRRNLGTIIFVDMRDRSGLVQVLFDETKLDKELFDKAYSIRNEFVIAVTGEVAKRSGDINENLKTGEIEILADDLRILSESDTPPFPIEPGIDTKEEVRLKYRTLDLRRSDIQNNIITRSRVTQLMRHFLCEDEGFIEIETPMLTKSTPEGARDYLVPSRVHQGHFYALPQSPQLFKQMLMASGYDRYMQIARCFRDEDLRADRQPEFTQMDMEMSFVTAEDVMDVTERLVATIFKEILGVNVTLPLPRMTWQEAMDRFGSDKPDVRFGMELQDVSELVKSCGFGVFTGAIEAGGSVRAINAKGFGDMSRKQIDALVEFAKGYEAKGLAYIQIQPDGTEKSSFAKFMTDEEMTALKEKMGAEAGDLILFAADRDKIVYNVLGALRLELAGRKGLRKPDEYALLWVTEFPQFEWSDEEERFVAMHHPFTMPLEEDLDRLESDLGNVRAKAYDIVLNGVELGGGSERIHRADVQERMFAALGIDDDTANEKFGFLLEAFRYGVPPHAGLAIGLDRLIMLMTGAESIRDVIAFPKVKDASCLLTGAPDTVDDKQIEELGIKVSCHSEQGEEA